jgi:hypothetical protein
MERAEAEAIYDSGREACVEFILDLAGRVEQHEDRLKRLEEQARQDSRTSSKPPSMDPPKTRAQRRAEARAKAKELMRKEGERRKQGGQPGHRGAGRQLRPSDQMDEIVDHYPEGCGACGARFAAEQQRPDGRFGRHQVADLPPISVIFSEHRTRQLRCQALPRTDQRLLARGDRRVAVRAAFAGGAGDVDGRVSDLAARDRRACSRSVRRHALDRRGRRDLPARL